jgi:hypothetical protein
MAILHSFGGLYSSFPPNKPNQPLDAKALNPLPENKMNLETGNAGRDGYTVVSRASRISGERFIAGTEPELLSPNLNED